jgi:hypothetical protein
MSLPNMEYAASCHCGALMARSRTRIAPVSWSVRACQCSFCRAHGALSTSDPHGWLSFDGREAQQVRRYRFGLGTADFMLCGACGVFVGAQMKSERGRFGILNVRTLRPLIELPVPQSMDYDVENRGARQERREQRWTPLADESV